MIKIGNLVKISHGAPIALSAYPWARSEPLAFFKAGTIGLVVNETNRTFTDEFICLFDDKLYYVSVGFLRRVKPLVFAGQ